VSPARADQLNSPVSPPISLTESWNIFYKNCFYKSYLPIPIGKAELHILCRIFETIFLETFNCFYDQPTVTIRLAQMKE
jgi:hypothetical protein